MPAQPHHRQLERVSSPIAFLFRYVVPAPADTEARVIIDALPVDDRRVLELLANVSGSTARTASRAPSPRSHNIPFVVTWTFILLFGWRGFNPGSTGSSVERLMVAIDDDGVGFDSVPWSIAARIAEVGGEVTFDDDRPGGHLRVWLPLV